MNKDYMEEDLIDYDTAKLCERLGIDFKELKMTCLIKDGVKYITQAMLQQYLREKLDCIVFPIYLLKSVKSKDLINVDVEYCWGYEIYYNNKNYDEDQEYNSYKDALGMALFIALKLIEHEKEI